MDRRTLLAISLSFGIFILWQKFYIEPRLPQPGQQAAQITQTAQTATPMSTPQVAAQTATTLKAAAPVVQQRAPQLLTLATGTGDVVLSNGPQLINQWNLKDFHVSRSSSAPNIDLQSVTHQSNQLGFAVDDTQFAYLSQVTGDLKPTPTGALWTYEDANLKLEKEITADPQKKFLDVKYIAEFKNRVPSFSFVSIQAFGATTSEKDPEEQDRQLLYFTNKSIERISVKDTQTLKEVATPVQYVGAANRYFLMSVLPTGAIEPRALIQAGNNGGVAAGGKINLVYPVTGKTITLPLRVYFGPKDLEILRAINPILDHTVDFGWFTVVAYPLLKLLKWFYQYFGNYGFAIILLTLFVKVITYPLTYKSVKSMKDMARIQPQLAKLREKYANDKESLNREMLTLMRSHGYNPAAGCFPILIQMPIFFALYRVLYGSIELYQAPFALWIMDLSAKDPFYVTPVLLSLSMFLQQKLTPNTATDPVQAKMIQWMPVIFGVFMLGLPAGLTIYMLTNAIASIAQQMVLNKKFDIPHARPSVIEVK